MINRFARKACILMSGMVMSADLLSDQNDGFSVYSVPSFALDGETPEERKNPVLGVNPTQYGVIAGNVWHDKNTDGLQHPDRAIERGIGKIRVELLGEDALIITNTVTDGSGFYQFQQLDFQPYLVHFVVPFGCRLSPQDVSDNHKDGMDSDAEVSSGLTKFIKLSANSAAKLSVSAGMTCQNKRDLLNPRY